MLYGTYHWLCVSWWTRRQTAIRAPSPILLERLLVMEVGGIRQVIGSWETDLNLGREKSDDGASVRCRSEMRSRAYNDTRELEQRSPFPTRKEKYPLHPLMLVNAKCGGRQVGAPVCLRPLGALFDALQGLQVPSRVCDHVQAPWGSLADRSLPQTFHLDLHPRPRCCLTTIACFGLCFEGWGLRRADWLLAVTPISKTH